MGVLAHDVEGQEAEVGALGGQAVEGGEGDGGLVADAVDVHDDAVGVLAVQDAFQKHDHAVAPCWVGAVRLRKNPPAGAAGSSGCPTGGRNRRVAGLTPWPWPRAHVP